MATITKTLADAPGTDAQERPARWWQLPFFLLGLAAFLLVYWLHPTRRGDGEERVFERDLATIRSLLTRSAAEANSALAMAERAQEQVARYPQRAGEVAFLLGSAHARVAELTADTKGADPSKAREHWLLARQILEQATNLGVQDVDKPRLQYRLARACFMLGDEPERVVSLLAGVVGTADNPVEGYQMLIETYLRAAKPDLQAALDANEKLRNVPSISEEVAAHARLQAGDLLLKLQKPEEARKVLKLIGSQAPVEVQVQARLKRARSFQDEGKWGEAATLWVQAAADTRFPDVNFGRINLDLGYCYFRLGQPTEATGAWEKCLRSGNGPEQRAAAVQLAELQIQNGTADKALETLEGPLSNLRSPGEWKAEQVELSRLTDLCERAIQATGKKERELAIRWTQLYQKVAAPARAQQMRADLLAEAGREQLQAAANPADVSAATALREQATKSLSEAARTYIEAVDATSNLTAQAELLWKASDAALLAQDREPAIQWLNRLIELLNPEKKEVAVDQKAQRYGQAWYLMAETLRQMNSPKAEEAYRNCIGTPGPHQYLARYQLAQYSLRRGEVDDAELTLKQNLHGLRFAQGNEGQEGLLYREASERSLYALGGLYFQQTKYQEVVHILEEALGKFPTNPEATRSHLQLAESYRQLSLQNNMSALTDLYKSEEAREHAKREHRRWLAKAAAEFENLARFLEMPESTGHLTPDERIQIPFTVATCRFDLGQFKDALAIYNHLAERHKGTLLALDAMAGAVRCHAALEQNEPLQRRLTDIRAQLSLLNDEAQRGQWEEWLSLAGRPAPKKQDGPGGTRSMSPRQPGQPLQPTQPGQPVPVQPMQLQPGQLPPGTITPGGPVPGVQFQSNKPDRINPNIPPR
jgi:hypothetical protein